MDFSNETILPDNLPRYESVQTTPIEPQFKKVILWNYAILLLIICGINIAGFFLDAVKSFMPVVAGISVIFAGVLLVLQLRAFKRRSWAIREHDIMYRYGLLSVVTTIIPFNRIQHVAVYEGFFQRIYGLASLKIFTAGGSLSDMSISGLKKEEADQIREWILQKIRQ